MPVELFKKLELDSMHTGVGRFFLFFFFVPSPTYVIPREDYVSVWSKAEWNCAILDYVFLEIKVFQG